MFNFTQGKKTVADILGAFSKTIEDLMQLDAEQQEEAQRQADIAANAEKARVAALNESAHAREVAVKLSGLIGADSTVTELTIGELAKKCA